MKKPMIMCLLVFWVGAISFGLTMMHSWHYADLSEGQKPGFEISKVLPEVEEFGVAHFLTPTCSCSVNIFEHLEKRGPLEKQGVKEVIVLIDDQDGTMSAPLRKKGFEVKVYNHNQIKETFGNAKVKGVPLLTIYNKQRVVQYVGGYARASITPFTKIDIPNYLTQLKKGRKIASNPVIGCSVSSKYKKILDPFGLKYAGDAK